MSYLFVRSAVQDSWYWCCNDEAVKPKTQAVVGAQAAELGDAHMARNSGNHSPHAFRSRAFRAHLLLGVWGPGLQLKEDFGSRKWVRGGSAELSV